MKNYLPYITISKNGRGIWDMDVSKGCHSGMQESANGCYGDCYAHRSAKIRGYDFNVTIMRYFKNIAHERRVIKQINSADMPFIRIGCSGDPSEDWTHAFNMLRKIKKCNKEIVIITKHWTKIPEELLHELRDLKICINTSISALDSDVQIAVRLNEYNRLKEYCKSVLRIVSCDFNKENGTGLKLSLIQDWLFKNENIIDTVFRPSIGNPLINNKVINTTVSKFMSGKQLMSKFNRKTYIGKCDSCVEKCGVFNESIRRKPYLQQMPLFDLSTM